MTHVKKVLSSDQKFFTANCFVFYDKISIFYKLCVNYIIKYYI